MKKIKTLLLSALFGLILPACQMIHFGREPLLLINHGKSECVVVYDQSKPTEKFAFEELREIVKGTTDVELVGVDIKSPKAKQAKKRIVIGRNSLTQKLIDKSLLDSLKDQESLVTSRENDLILTGGDDWGMIYAVYDFVENEAGYRCYAGYPGGDKYVKSDKLVFSGKETRQRPAFYGYRITYTSPMMIWKNIDGYAKFCFRNRGTRLYWDQYGKGLSYANDIGLNKKYQQFIPGHGLFRFVPPYDQNRCVWGEGKLKGYFKEHPEYFSLNKDGRRVDNMQLCLSNPDLRELLTVKVLEAVKTNGPGIYMVGSEDHSNARYCYCPNCMELEKKYKSVGGPLWDYMLELCPKVKKECPGAYIHTLAYKGPKQTEKAPEGVEFPDNFICDAAFLNSDQTLREIAPETLEDGTVFKKFENLKRWGEIAKHVSYWYYGGNAPYQIYKRMQKEIKELHEAGVISVGSCGLGSMEFGDITTYLYFRLLINPDIDAEKVVNDFAEFKYGAAAPMMLEIIEELEAIRDENVGNKTNRMWCDDNYDRMTFLEAEQILRWQKMFDKMEELVKNEPVHSRNVKIARTAVDCLTIVLMHKIHSEFPDVKIDADQVIKRGFAAIEEATKAKMMSKRRPPAALRVLNDMSLYANLKDNTTPQELRKYPEDKIFRYLPVKPPVWNTKKGSLTKDADAVAQWTMKEKVKNPQKLKAGVPYEFYDSVKKEWVKRGLIPAKEITPGKYKLYNLFTTYLPSRNRLVFDGLWGTSLDIQKLGRYYDPSYQKRQFEYWASLKFEGPAFDPQSKAKDNTISCDQLFLVNKGMKKEE